MSTVLRRGAGDIRDASARRRERPRSARARSREGDASLDARRVTRDRRAIFAPSSRAFAAEFKLDLI